MNLRCCETPPFRCQLFTTDKARHAYQQQCSPDLSLGRAQTPSISSLILFHVWISACVNWKRTYAFYWKETDTRSIAGRVHAEYILPLTPRQKLSHGISEERSITNALYMLSCWTRLFFPNATLQLVSNESRTSHGYQRCHLFLKADSHVGV